MLCLSLVHPNSQTFAVNNIFQFQNFVPSYQNGGGANEGAKKNSGGGPGPFGSL